MLKSIIVLALAVSTATLAQKNVASVDVLKQQFSQDIKTTLKLVFDTLEGPEYVGEMPSDEKVNKDVEALVGHLVAENPNLLAGSNVEILALKEGRHLVTKEDFIKQLEKAKKMRVYKRPSSLLEYYEHRTENGGLNPAQRLIAYRLATHFEAQAMQAVEEAKKSR